MCGMFAEVYVDGNIELPYCPEVVRGDGVAWQSTQGLDVYGGPYRVTEGGRLERREKSFREKTDSEKQAEAEQWGYGSWEEYEQAYEDHDGLFTESIDPELYDVESGESPPLVPREEVVDEVLWNDQDFHGRFEFHRLLQKEPTEWRELERGDGSTVAVPDEYELDMYLEYDALFMGGELQDVSLMLERSDFRVGGDGDE